MQSIKLSTILIFASSVQVAVGGRATIDDAELAVGGRATMELLGPNATLPERTGLGVMADVQLHEDDQDEVVDFGFMTTDTRYPRHKAGFFGTIKQWFGGRATDDKVKEDIVEGHTCQKKGAPDESYYASSFCYWVPEFTTKTSGRGGLTWRGGNYKNGKVLSADVNAKGRCIKSSVCHNNARTNDGDVDKTTFVEDLPLPDGCMKETAIERECVGQYELANGDMKTEDARCQEVHARHSRTVEQWNQCNSKLANLPQQINVVMPQQIQRARQEVQNAMMGLERARGSESQERHRTHRTCERYQREKGNQYWMGMLLGQTNTEVILRQMHTMHCQYPHRHNNHNGDHHDDDHRHRIAMNVYHACQECKRAQGQLERAYRQINSAQSVIMQKQQVEPRLHQQINVYRQELSQWQQQKPVVDQAKQVMDSEWLPQSESCMATFTNYKNGKAQSVAACAPLFFESSCERECIEQMALDGGCGVVEGMRASDNTGVGGIEVTCDPVQPSWVMGPFTYGAQESKADQCYRIEASQKPQYATKILKAGWLSKKGRVGGWDDRYFQLESGDAVRSAVMRYWKQDPTKTSSAEERPGKGIILRDAKDVKAKSGKNYGYGDDEPAECFKLTHFYRTYKLCVTKEKSENYKEDRDDWVNFIQESILNDSR